MTLRSLGRFPVYPFLVAALPTIYFQEANFRMLGTWDGLRLTLLYWLVTLGLLLLGRLVWKDIHRAALVIGPLAVFLFLGQKVGAAAAVACLTMALGLGILLKRRPVDVSRGSVPLNAMVFVLAAMPLVQTVLAARAQTPPVPTALFRDSLELPTDPNGQQPPDIYFLLLDGLGQPTYLEEEFDLPPKLVEGVLKERGFQVLRLAEANYPQTALSLAATLNAGYIQELLEVPDPECADRHPLAELIADNRTARTLRGIGYDVVTFPSGYPLTRMDNVTRIRHPLIDPGFLEYYTLEEGALPLIQTTLGRGPSDLSFAMRRGRLEYVFDHLGRAREGIPDSRPVFVFAHIMAPHPPFVFSRTGEGLSSRKPFAFADGNHWYDIHGRDGTPYYIMYSEQLTYVMKRLGEAVDDILASSPRPPVIIVQGDHGPGSKMHHERPAYSDHRERMGIFSAWYAPPGVDLELAEGSTAVNTFPILFNAVFGARLPLADDRFYYARMSAPYAFLELKVKTD